MIYGKLEIQVVDDHTDQIGIRTLVLSQIWQPTKGDLSISGIDAEKPEVPGVPGGVLLIGEQTVRMAGAYKTTWTYEGINGDGKSVTFKDRGNTLDYGFEAGFKQLPIQQNPQWPDWKDKFGGSLDPDTNQVTWSQMVSTSNVKSASGLSTGNLDQQSDNPMLGYQDYFSLDGTYTCRYASLTLPGNLYDGVGRIYHTGSLPGKAPIFAKRNWLKMPPHYLRRGLVFDITELYWLSNEAGWHDVIYGGGSSSGGNAS